MRQARAAESGWQVCKLIPARFLLMSSWTFHLSTFPSVYANTAKAARKREWDEECEIVAESLFDRVLSTFEI